MMEKQRKVYLFTFPAGFHISQGGNEMLHSDSLLHSDMLSSALVAMGFRLYGADFDAIAFLNSFRLSSGFPWVGDGRYLPKPSYGISVAQSSPDRKREKQFKRIAYLRLDKFAEAVQTGALNWEPDEFSEDGLLVGGKGISAAWHKAVRQKVTLRAEPSDPETQASESQSLPYFVEEVYFPQNQGLFVLVDFLVPMGNPMLGTFEACMRLLGEEGIGSAKTRGLGRFTVREDLEADWGILDSLPTGTQRLMLSRFIPAPKDLDQCIWDQSAWDVQFIRGFIAAAPRIADRTRRRKGQHVFGAGSVLAQPEPPAGRLVDLAPEDAKIPSLREGRPLYLSLQLNS